MVNSIVLIDDREDFAIQFTEFAKSSNISVAHKKSFDGLKSIFPAFKHKFAAVVLDIKCLINEEQEKEDAGFITIALSYLDRSIPHFPRFILTGDDAEFESVGRYFRHEKVFKKTPKDLDALFQELKVCIENSEELSIKRENYNVFEIFNSGCLTEENERQLLNLLKHGLKETEFGKFKGILANIRALQESIYKSINSRSPNVVPNSMFRPNGMLKFNELMRHLNGYPNNFVPTKVVYQNNSIYHLTQALYWTCGEYIHEDRKKAFNVSDYTIKSLINILMELFIWSKQY